MFVVSMQIVISVGSYVNVRLLCHLLCGVYFHSVISYVSYAFKDTGLLNCFLFSFFPLTF